MPLRRSRPSILQESLGWIKLWRDDLAEMVDTIEQAVPGQSITIQVAGDYIADSIDDLVDYEQLKIEYVIVRVGEGRVLLTLTPTQASIEVVEPDLTLRGMVAELQFIARRCRTRIPIFIAIIQEISKATLAASGRFPMRGPSKDLLGNLSGAILISRTREEAPPFWKRKRDDLWITAASLLLGGLIGYLLNTLTSAK